MIISVHFFLDKKTNQKNQGIRCVPLKAEKPAATDESNSLRSNRLSPFTLPCFLTFIRNTASARLLYLT